MNIIVLIALAIVFRIGFDVFASKAGGKLNDFLASGIFSLIAGVLPLLVYMAVKSKNDTPTTKEGVIYSVLAGVAVAAFSVVLVRIFARGGNLSFVIPAIYGGTLIGVSLIGWTLFKEPVSTLGVAGVLVIAAGVVMIAMARA